MGKSRINFWGKVSVGLILLLLVMMLCPINEQTHAETSDNPDEVLGIQDVNTETRLWVQPVVSVALSPKVDIEITPTSTGSFSQSSADLSIATNSKDGMKVLLNAVGGTSLNPAGETGTQVVESIKTAVAKGEFASNSWGYYVGMNEPGATDKFSPIPQTSTEVLRTETSSTQQTYKVTFGTMIDSSLPAGLYKSSVMVSVVVNPIQAVSINDLYYLQDIKPEICAASKIWESESDSKSLVDYRDGKAYKVARLKDGNCWMQENLALGLSKSKALTPSDTDIPASWTPTVDVASADNMTYAAGVALAGTQGTATTNGAEYAGSICPKGWKLPLGGTANQNVSGSLYNLVINAHGATVETAVNAPLYFVGADYVSRTARSSSEAWTDRIYVPSYFAWASGEPFTDPVAVRCVVTVGGE